MNIGIIGAGIIGVNCALALQDQGHAVTIFDPSAGNGASQGNAGCFALSEVTPIAMPGILAKVPGMLRDRNGPLAVRWSYLPRLIPWLWRFLRASERSRVEAIADALASLAGRAEADYEPRLAEAGLSSLVARKGALFAFSRPAAFARSPEEWSLKAARGVEFDTLDGDAMRKAEPALGARTIGGYFVPGWSHVRDPALLTEELLQHFLRRNGVLVARRVEDVRPSSRGIELTLAGRPSPTFDRVVVAAGAHAHAPLCSLMPWIPLDTERGYNTTLPSPGVELQRPVCVVESGYFMTPMSMGLRIGGGVELGGLDAAPNWRRADVMVEDAVRAVPGLNTAGGQRWMGFRPSMPDSLPVIGRVTSEPRVLLAFGHGHLGLTLAATTGRLVAELAADATPSVDLKPFSPDRFRSLRATPQQGRQTDARSADPS